LNAGPWLLFQWTHQRLREISTSLPKTFSTVSALPRYSALDLNQPHYRMEMVPARGDGNIDGFHDTIIP